MTVTETPITFNYALLPFIIVPIVIGITVFCVCHVCKRWCQLSTPSSYNILNDQYSITTDERPHGLKNISSQCYMNAMIQAIASSELIIRQLDSLKSAHSDSLSLTYLVNLLHAINQPYKPNNIEPDRMDLLEKLLSSVDWDKPDEQDAFQLFSAVINGIQKDCINNDTVPFETSMKIKLVHMHSGVDFPDKIQDHLGLSLGLCGNFSSRPGVTVEYLVNQHFATAPIDNDPFKTTQMLFYRDAPDILILHIQANKWHSDKGEMIKPEYHIIYDEQLSLDLDIMTELNVKKIKRDTFNYEIRAVVQHTGTISTGHYITFRSWRDSWYKVNDEQVTKVLFDRTICPYILIYQRKADKSKKFNKESIEINQ